MLIVRCDCIIHIDIQSDPDIMGQAIYLYIEKVEQ